MPLDLQMLLTAVQINSGYGPIGTGFFVTVASDVPETPPYGYLVTAYHVIHKQTDLEAEIPNAFNGEIYPPLPVNNWEQPLKGVDVAVAAIDHPDDRNYMGVPLDHIMPMGEAVYPQLGGTVFYIGLFAPARRMMARSGTIGALEQLALSKKLDDPDLDLEYVDYPVHLVDCRSYNGFSGSPCFAEFTYPGLVDMPLSKGIPMADTVKVPLGRNVYCAMLCGMFIAHFSDEGAISTRGDVVSKYGVGMMVRGHEIKEALMHEDVAKERRRLDKERRANMQAEVLPEQLHEEATTT
jgi:hypothetical protein